MRRVLLIVCGLCMLLCRKEAIQEGAGPRKIRRVAVAAVIDHPAYSGSGEIIGNGIVTGLQEMGFSVLHREKPPTVSSEIAIAKGMGRGQKPSDAVVVCRISEFLEKDRATVPIRFTTRNAPEQDPYQQSAAHTKDIRYTNARVSVTVTVLDTQTGYLIESSKFEYTSLSLADAVERCVKGALRPLKKLR